MEVSLNFEIAVYLSWILGVGLFLLVIQFLPARWHALGAIRLERPGREVLWALAAVVLLVGISVATDNLFGPWKRHPSFGRLVYFGQLLLVYSPIFALLLWRRQGLKTCFLRFDKLPVKILLGLGVALIASFIFLLVRGRAGAFPEFLTTLGKGGVVGCFSVHGRFRHRILTLPLGRMDGIGCHRSLSPSYSWRAYTDYTAESFHLSLPVALLARWRMQVLGFYRLARGRARTLLWSASCTGSSIALRTLPQSNKALNGDGSGGRGLLQRSEVESDCKLDGKSSRFAERLD